MWDGNLGALLVLSPQSSPHSDVAAIGAQSCVDLTKFVAADTSAPALGASWQWASPAEWC